MENLGRLDIQKTELYQKSDLQELKDLQNKDKKRFSLKVDNVLDAFSQKVFEPLVGLEKFNPDKALVAVCIQNLGEEEVLGISDIFNQCRIDNNLQTA